VEYSDGRVQKLSDETRRDEGRGLDGIVTERDVGIGTTRFRRSLF
jgi:hypothetical protein